jgi:hypothetical protein
MSLDNPLQQQKQITGNVKQIIRLDKKSILSHATPMATSYNQSNNKCLTLTVSNKQPLLMNTKMLFQNTTTTQLINDTNASSILLKPLIKTINDLNQATKPSNTA